MVYKWGICRCQVKLPGVYSLWLFNIAMENGPFIDDFPIKTWNLSGIFYGYVKWPDGKVASE